MKYTYLAILVVIFLLVVPVSAYHEDFQNYDGGISVLYIDGNDCSAYAKVQQWYWGHPELLDLHIKDRRSTTCRVMNSNPQAFYNATVDIAAYDTGSCWSCLRVFEFYNENMVEVVVGDFGYTDTGRYDFVISDGDMYQYRNGVFVESNEITGNPSYMAIVVGADLFVDINDFAISPNPSSDSSTLNFMESLPPDFYVLEDVFSPAASGLYQLESDGTKTLIDSNYFNTWYSFTTPATHKVQLQKTDSGAVYATQYTNTSTGYLTWNITDLASAPNGQYHFYVDGLVYSPTSFWVVSQGGSIEFDETNYVQGTTATFDWVVSESYWDTATYDYSWQTMDAYGTTVDSGAITARTGSGSVSIDNAYENGVYYIVLVATEGTDEYQFAFDYANVVSEVVLQGYVKDAETTDGISGASVMVVQGSTSATDTTGTSGDYISSHGWDANVEMTLSASATGYETYNHTFTPLANGVIALNITLMPNSPTYSGIALGGIAHVLPYNRTVNSATIEIQNASYGNYHATTNSAGYYLLEWMPDGYWWDVWGHKAGLQNSTVYNILVEGS